MKEIRIVCKNNLISSKEADLIFANVKAKTYDAFNVTVQDKSEDEVNVTCPHCGSNIRIKLRVIKLSSKAKIQKWFTISGLGSLLLIYFFIHNNVIHDVLDNGLFIGMIFLILITSIVGAYTGFAFFNPVVVGDNSHDLRFS